MTGESNGSRWVLQHTVYNTSRYLLLDDHLPPWQHPEWNNNNACFITVIKDITAGCPTLGSEAVLSQLFPTTSALPGSTELISLVFINTEETRRRPQWMWAVLTTNAVSGVSESGDKMWCVNSFSHFGMRCQTVWALASPVAHTDSPRGNFSEGDVVYWTVPLTQQVHDNETFQVFDVDLLDCLVLIKSSLHSKNKWFGSTAKMNATVCVNLFWIMTTNDVVFN